MGLVTRLMMIAAVMLASGALLITLMMVMDWLDLGMGLLAFAACSVSAMAAHVAAEYPRGDAFIAVRLAMSMVVRTALPLAVCVLAKFTEILPFEPGLIVLVFLFYLIGLMVDVKLQSVRLGSQ